jgi:bifunctional non-homologous end joining protein LigD
MIRKRSDPLNTAGRLRRQTLLEEYRRKRDFERTSEPRGQPPVRRRAGHQFVVQKHAATRLHYDFRLELDDVMKSWAVPKGPSLDPAEKRLAVRTEDHPIEYNRFEGRIPAGEYGAGEVIVWDYGTYRPEKGDWDTFREGLVKGRITFLVRGKRLRGSWSLIRMARGRGHEWLLIKKRDAHAVTGDDLTGREQTSVRSGRTLEDVARGRRKRRRGQRTPPPNDA